ncbi:GNAT family N-acetyltransferase [Streptomyces stelliscabiei]|uniref:GNAT family N-acetyltransferase n=1 Tax=Streptomyces stelliscabiei TaxID=146820 RepID=UPI003A921A0D
MAPRVAWRAVPWPRPAWPPARSSPGPGCPYPQRRYSPRFRSRGYAAMVVTALLDALVERGCTCIELRSTAAGRALYQRLGFTEHADLMVFKPAGGQWLELGTARS